uniref:Uncharacterized protein n=1 Tax=Pyxicephalus adspersus TaxID=30357 RepID=A0AAV3B7T0_PYXAD|nr:TPA: hypothetical protein GDO54_007580 [Pyxicephalus adspersus]
MFCKHIFTYLCKENRNSWFAHIAAHLYTDWLYQSYPCLANLYLIPKLFTINLLKLNRNLAVLILFLCLWKKELAMCWLQSCKSFLSHG